MRKLLFVLFILTLLVGSTGRIALADPPLPLPYIPICGDQDGSETPFTYHCPDFVPSTDVQTYQVPGTGSVSLRFDFVYRAANYDNELGYFKVDTASGSINGLKPGSPDYLAAVLQRAAIIFPSGSTAYAPDVTLTLTGGDILVFFIVQGSTLERLLANNPNNDINKGPLAFFGINSVNPDAVDHFIGFENTSSNYTQFGFEDITGGGDRDYDDIVYNISPPLTPLTGQIDLNPANANVTLDQSHTLTARVSDQSDVPLAGVAVTFTVDGINPQTYSAITDAAGQAVFVYKSTRAGQDVIVASATIGDKNITSNRALVNWLASSPITIFHIEVTQVTQDENNSVPLIAGKPTLVRVYVDCGEGCTSLANVTGVLEATGPNGGISLLPHPASITAYHLGSPNYWTSQRGDLRTTLNFSLPTNMPPGRVTLKAIVNGVQQSEVVDFQSAKTLTVAFVPVKLNNTLPSEEFRTGFAWAQRVYPIARIQPVFLAPLDVVGSVSGEQNAVQLAQVLEERLNLYRASISAPNPDDLPSRIYGWLPDGSFGGGISYPLQDPATGQIVGGTVAFGDDSPRQRQLIFAHEIAHLLGRPHPRSGPALPNRLSCANPTPNLWTDWPYDDARIQTWGIDLTNASKLKDPGIYYDYMSYCWDASFGLFRNAPAWTSDWTYRHIFTQFLSATTTASHQVNTTTSRSADLASVMVVSGIIESNGIATLRPAWTIPTNNAQLSSSTGTTYCLEAQDISGGVLEKQCFDLASTNGTTNNPTEAQSFSRILVYPNGLARLVLKAGSQELTSRSISAHTPLISVTSPKGDDVWPSSGERTITWIATDPDNDPLSYSVLYSPDGVSWTPIANSISDAHLTIDTAYLAGSINARIRVLASDGLNTSVAELSTRFTVARKDPHSVILSPEANDVIPPEATILLQGYGYDAEDGRLADTNLHWRSDRDGDLGTGTQVQVTLSPGQHVITLQGNDSDGNIAMSTVRVFIGYKLALPLITEPGNAPAEVPTTPAPDVPTATPTATPTDIPAPTPTDSPTPTPPDPLTPTPMDIPAPPTPTTAPAPPAARLYVTNSKANTVSIVDTASNAIIGTIPVGAGAQGIAAKADGSRVYSADSAANQVSVIDPAQQQVVATIPVGAGPVLPALSSGNRLYVTNNASNSVTVINTPDNNVIKTLSDLQSGPWGVAVSPDKAHIAVTLYDTGRVVIYTTTDFKKVTEVALGSAPEGIIYHPDGSKLYVANFGSDTVSIIDTSTYAVTPVAVSRPVQFAFNGAASKLYVASDNASVSEIDVASGTVLRSFAVGAGPRDVEVVGAYLYVTNYDDNTLSVVDLASGLVTATIQGFDGPHSIARQ